MIENDLTLPPDMLMGFATSSWQIEGQAGTRGRSIWDDFIDVPGRMKDGATAEPATDHINRMDEDLDLLAWLGVGAYRFSVSWPRVLPEGRGPVSREGLGVYDRLVDGLLARGIQPIATLFHWDYPAALHTTTPWHDRGSADAFADYAEVVGRVLGDRVARWGTFNEPWCSAFLGFSTGAHAPGDRDPGRALNVAYNLMLAHGRALERLRGLGLSQIGIAPNIIPVYAENEASERSAAIIDGLQNAFWLDLLAGKGIPESVIEATAPFTDWSFVEDDDLDLIAAPIDWIGENYYTVMRVRAGTDSGPDAVTQDPYSFPGAGEFSFVPRGELTEVGWEVHPAGLAEALLRIAAELPGVEILVTENGIACPETHDQMGIHDTGRIAYYRNHVQAALDARDQGAPVSGYLGWTLLDNLEWTEAWRLKFGIIAVDGQTQARTPKDSAHWWKSLLARR